MVLLLPDPLCRDDVFVDVGLVVGVAELGNWPKFCRCGGNGYGWGAPEVVEIVSVFVSIRRVDTTHYSSGTCKRHRHK